MICINTAASLFLSATITKPGGKLMLFPCSSTLSHQNDRTSPQIKADNPLFNLITRCVISHPNWAKCFDSSSRCSITHRSQRTEDISQRLFILKIKKLHQTCFEVFTHKVLWTATICYNLWPFTLSKEQLFLEAGTSKC